MAFSLIFRKNFLLFYFHAILLEAFQMFLHRKATAIADIKHKTKSRTTTTGKKKPREYVKQVKRTQRNDVILRNICYDWKLKFLWIETSLFALIESLIKLMWCDMSMYKRKSARNKKKKKRKANGNPMYIYHHFEFQTKYWNRYGFAYFI